MNFVREVQKGLENFLAQSSDIHSFGRYLETVSIYPVFLSVHCVLIALALRTHDNGTREFAKNHLIPSWFVCVTSCYGGTIIQNILLSEPIIVVLRNEKTLLLGSLSWYLVFFCPHDLFWKTCQLKLVKAILLFLKEVHRLRMISNGVAIASVAYPDTWAITVMIGAIRGSGAKFIMKPLFHFVKGDMMICSELLKPHFSTRSSVIISFLLWNQSSGFFEIQLTREALLVAIFIYMTFFQIMPLFIDSIKDPYAVIQDPICYVLFTLPAEMFRNVGRKAKAE